MARLKELLFLVAVRALATSKSVKNRIGILVLFLKNVFTQWNSKWNNGTFYRSFIYSVFV